MNGATQGPRRMQVTGQTPSIWPKLLRAIADGIRLRCPHCHDGRTSYRLFDKLEHCPRCGMELAMGEGDFVGVIMMSYSVTAVLVAALAWGLYHLVNWPAMTQVILWGVVVTAWIPLTWRNFRGFWIAFVYLAGGLQVPGQEER